MPRIGFLLSAALLAPLTAPSFAQDPNLISCFPEATTYTGRLGITPDDSGDILLQFNAAMFQGIGTAAGGTVTAMRYVIQDQEGDTSDPYDVVIRGDDGAGLPDLTGDIVRIVGLTLPVNTGPSAWIVTTPLGGAIPVPQEANFYAGIGIAPNTLWTADGLSVHSASYVDGGAGASPSNPNTLNLAYSVKTSPLPVEHVTSGLNRVHKIYLLTDGVTLEAGADNPAITRCPTPTYGPRAYFPDRSQNDGIVFRVRDAASPSGVFAVLGQILAPHPPFEIPGFVGEIYLEPWRVFPSLIGGGALDPNGEGVSFPAPYPFDLGPGAFMHQISAQAVTDLGGVQTWSNIVATDDTP